MQLLLLKDLKGDNEDENTGINIIRVALEEPLRTIVANSGLEGSIVVQKVKEGTGAYGYNAKDNVYEDLVGAGIIDPTKVSRVALENAASIAGLLLTTECVIADEPEESCCTNGWRTRRWNGWNDVIIPKSYILGNKIAVRKIPNGYLLYSTL